MSDTALRTHLRTELAALKEKGLYKAERQIATPQKPGITVNGREVGEGVGHRRGSMPCLEYGVANR